MPDLLSETDPPVYTAVVNNGDLAFCIGTWPGDETDSELLQSLIEIRLSS